MKLSVNHSQSSYGVPVFVDDDNNSVDYAVGIRKLREELNKSRSDFGAELGVSPRTVEAWENGLRMPSKSALLLMSKMI